MYEDAIGDIYASFGPVAQWDSPTPPLIHQHQSESPTEKAEMLHRIGSAIRDSEDRDRVLSSIRLQALEDAPGRVRTMPKCWPAATHGLPYRDAEEDASPRRPRVDRAGAGRCACRRICTCWLTMTAFLNLLAWLPEDVFRHRPPRPPKPANSWGWMWNRPRRNPEPVYEWVGNNFCSGFDPVGQVMLCYSFEWIGLCDRHPHQSPRFKTKSEACAWVEAQFNNPKNR